MDPVRFIKSFSKGQITIPKEFRKLLGMKDEFWLKLTLDQGKIVAEPIETKKDKTSYKIRLLSIKGDWINPKEIAVNRNQVEMQLSKRAT